LSRVHRRATVVSIVASQQVRFDVADSESEQVMVDQGEHLDVCRGHGLRKIAEQPEDLAALREVTQRKFAGHPRVGEHLAVLE